MNFKASIISIPLFLLLTASCQSQQSGAKGNKPNIVIIYLDDLGYGDLSCYGGKGLQTPHIDKLMAGGIRFTNGYASSATCTPSRYALLTGQYPWKKSGAKILPGDAPLLIDTNQMTLPKMLKQHAYTTAVVGKWHLGLGSGNVDWNKEIKPGPNDVGFDYSYILAATQDRVPTVYVENGRVKGVEAGDPLLVSYKQNFEGEPTALTHPEMLTMKWHHGHNNSIVNGVPRIGFMKGGKNAQWVDTAMANVFLNEARRFVRQSKDGPFFLYYAMQQPHVPRIPGPAFEGKSGLGPRGDVILEADWCVGEFMKTLEAEGLLNNTLIIFSSDNGPVLNDGYYDDAVEKNGNHTPAGILRGGKYSLFEAGTRVPFSATWLGKIKPGISDAVVCQLDLLNSLAALVDMPLSGFDSQNLLDALMGKSATGRTSLVLEASGKLALRKDDWIYIPPYEGPAVLNDVNIELGLSSEEQLYNLSNDPVQQHNIASANAKKLKELKALFETATAGSTANSKQTLKLQ